MAPRRKGRDLLDRPFALTVITILCIGTALGAAALLGYVHDSTTLSHAFGLISMPLAVFIFLIAQYLNSRMRDLRAYMLRDADERNIAHMSSIVNLCRAQLLGALHPGDSPPGSLNTGTMRSLAADIGMVRAQYGYLLSRDGKQSANMARDSALAALRTGSSCDSVALSDMIDFLSCLEGEMLDLDGPELVARRKDASGTAG